MENASKALLIAGGVLITIIVVNIGIILSKNMAKSSSEFYTIMSEHEITEFNEKFTRYKDKELTIQDFATIMNLARDYNQKNGFTEDDEESIVVTIDKVKIINKDMTGEEDESTSEIVINKEKIKEICKDILILNTQNDNFNNYETSLKNMLLNEAKIEGKQIQNKELYFEITEIKYSNTQLVNRITIQMVETITHLAG